MRRFSIVWRRLERHVVEDWELPAREGLVVPFFVDEHDSKGARAENDASLEPYDLLRGLLVAYKDDAPGDEPAAFRAAAAAIVDRLGREFGLATPEETILKVAVRMREEYSVALSRTVLEAGAALLPDSAKIRADLIVDLWFSAEHGAAPDLAGIFEAIADHARRIDLDAIDRSAAELPVYANAVALHYLGRNDERDAYIRDVVSRRVRRPEFRERIARLETGRPFDMAELRIRV